MNISESHCTTHDIDDVTYQLLYKGVVSSLSSLRSMYGRIPPEMLHSRLYAVCTYHLRYPHIAPEQIATMTLGEIMKDEWKAIADRQKASASNTKCLPQVERKCKRCPSNLAYYSELNTRSSDEGTTSVYQCVSCGGMTQVGT